MGLFLTQSHLAQLLGSELHSNKHCEAREVGKCVGTMTPHDLVELARRYDVPLDPSAVRALLEDDGDEHARLLMEWAKSHLTEDTLLTKDELNSYVAVLLRNQKLMGTRLLKAQPLDTGFSSGVARPTA